MFQMWPAEKLYYHSWEMPTFLICLLILKRKLKSILRSDWVIDIQKNFWWGKKLKCFILIV